MYILGYSVSSVVVRAKKVVYLFLAAILIGDYMICMNSIVKS